MGIVDGRSGNRSSRGGGSSLVMLYLSQRRRRRALGHNVVEWVWRSVADAMMPASAKARAKQFSLDGGWYGKCFLASARPLLVEEAPRKRCRSR